MPKVERYKRPTRAAVRKSAKDGPKGGGGPPLFILPDGMETVIPTKAGIYKIDIVPYPVREEEHPERIKKGVLWMKRMVRVHRTPGGTIICPKSVFSDRKCRWCRQFFKIKKQHEEREQNGDELSDKEKETQLRPFKGQTWECFFRLHPKDPTKVAFFPMSYGKFAKKLNEVCEVTNQKNLMYFETDKTGKTLKCTFNEKKFNGQKFLECTNIEFRPREELSEQKIISQTVDIASMCNVLDDEKLKKLFFQSDDDGEDEKPTKKIKKKSKSRDKDEDADSDEEDSDEDNDETPKKGKKKKMVKKSKDKDEEKKSTKKKSKVKPEKKAKKPEKKKSKKSKDDDDDDDDSDEEE